MVNSFLTSNRWCKAALAGLAIAGLTTFITPVAFCADTATTPSATTKPVKLPEIPAEVKETSLDPILATVDGIPVDREKFNNLLMAIGGPRLFEQVITFILAQEACDKAGIEIKPADIEAEKTRMLADIGRQYPDVKESDREKVLGMILQKQGITGLEFQLSMQRAASLRALAKGKATPTPEQIDEAWAINNADKVDVLDIVVPNTDKKTDFAAAAELRKFVDANKKSPLELAQQSGYRVNQYTFSSAAKQNNDAAKKLQQLAFQLKENELSAAQMIGASEGKPGELHVLYCLKKIPATNKTMTAADRTKLTADMTEAMERDWANRHLNKLMAEAHIDIKDKTLSAYYADVNARARAAATQNAATTTAPATQSATQPAPATPAK